MTHNKPLHILFLGLIGIGVISAVAGVLVSVDWLWYGGAIVATYSAVGYVITLRSSEKVLDKYKGVVYSENMTKIKKDYNDDSD